MARKINETLAFLTSAKNESSARAAFEEINFTFDNFNMQFSQLTYKLIVDFSQGSVEKFSSEFQNLKNFNWDQMGVALIVWQQKNIIQNPLCSFGVNYDYKKPIINPPIDPIRKPTFEELGKLRIENSKNAKTRRANGDMSQKFRMEARIGKIFNIFSANKDNFFIDGQKRYFVKTKDLTSDSLSKYEKSHDILLFSIKSLKQNWCRYLENQNARKFSKTQRDTINMLFWGSLTQNLISTSILSNGDIDHAIAIFHAFLGLSASLNFPHKQLMHLPLRDTYTTLKTRGTLTEYIKKSLDWSASNSTVVHRGGLTELPLVTIHKLANEQVGPEDEYKKGDLQIVEDLLMNRNVTNSHLVNDSNGYLLNDDMFSKRQKNY